LVLGGLLAAGSAMMAEMLDRRVHVPEDVEVLLGLPVLALVEYAEIRELSRFDLLKFRLKTLVGRRAA
jgi:capsular polysaccharide biosynthesis protein